MYMTTILFFHICVALAGIVMSGLALLRPSARLLRFSYGAVALTFASGTYLVIAGPAHLVSSCISGIIYLGVVSAGLVPARMRLARQNQL